LGPAYELVVVPYSEARGDDSEVRGDVLDRLGPSDRNRLARLDGDARHRFLSGRVAAITAIGRLVADPMGASTIDACCAECGGPHGRPEVSGTTGTVHVAIAHAAGRAFAVASRSRIGVDAEPLDTPAERLDAIRALTRSGGGGPLARWTAIEAVLKADGRGLRVDPREVQIGRAAGNVADRGIRYRLHRHRDVAGCLVTVAWRDPRDVAREGRAERR
jgi:4'-phosphopantetheinyl transferase